MSPPAVLVIENLHLFIGNSDKLKQFVIDGFRWEVKEQMSFMVLLTRLKKLISVCRCCQSFTWCCPNSTMLQELKNTAVLPQTSMAPPAGGFHDRVNINFLSIHYISYGLLIFFEILLHPLIFKVSNSMVLQAYTMCSYRKRPRHFKSQKIVTV